jgi:hypothetical protein
MAAIGERLIVEFEPAPGAAVSRVGDIKEVKSEVA